MNTLSKPVKSFLLLTGFFIVGCLLIACSEEKVSYLSISGRTMGTTYNIKISKPISEKDSIGLKREVDELLINVNKVFSTYLPESEVSLFNKSTSIDWQIQSIEFINLLRSALSISDETDGAYDVTVGPLVNLWGFGPDFSGDNIPSQVMINSILEKVGASKLEIDGSRNRIKKSQPDIYLDFSSIAKGYGVDKVSELISSKGYSNFMVEIGGEIRVHGLNSEKEKWRIAVEKPDTSKRAIHKILSISDTALATSGSYRNYFDNEGRRYSHTINPLTGWPVEHDLVSVTVLADTSMEADAWATAFMVLGAEKGYDSAIKNGLSVLFIIKIHNTLQEVTTPGFKVFIKD